MPLQKPQAFALHSPDEWGRRMGFLAGITKLHNTNGKQISIYIYKLQMKKAGQFENQKQKKKPLRFKYSKVKI